jgi:hypothetical protein
MSHKERSALKVFITSNNFREKVILNHDLISLVHLAEFLYIVELCPHNTRFLWYTGSVHIHLQTTYMQTEYKHTTQIVFVRSVAIANATNTTTIAPLLFLLSIYVLAPNYPWGGCVFP